MKEIETALQRLEAGELGTCSDCPMRIPAACSSARDGWRRPTPRLLYHFNRELLRHRDLFRERLLARLVDKHAISRELANKLLSWRHPGFSAHAGEAIPAGDSRAMEDMASYVVRNPVS